MAVLIVLGGLFAFGLLAIVAVYIVRRRRRLNGYSQLLAKPEAFQRVFILLNRFCLILHSHFFCSRQ
jgi:hypothetical protein